MPIWGWVCVGLAGAAALGLAILIWFGMQRDKWLLQNGKTVVARVILANPSLYTEKPSAFEFAFVLFTREADSSEQHLAFLAEIADELKGFEPDETNSDEKKLAWAIQTQRTIGDVVRVPDRITGGREVFFSTPNVKRRLLPEGKLTREYICLLAVVEGKNRDVSMIEYPDAPMSGQ